jgi:tRNA (mo5U34)-methyltransferase
VAALAARKRAGTGFELAKRALGSNARREELSVYDVSEAATGRFDFIFLGSLLLHLRDPVLALERLRDVCDGELLVLDVFDPWLTAQHPRRALATLDARDRPWWWQSNLAGLLRMIDAAGWRRTGRIRLTRMPSGAGQPVPAARPGLLRDRAGRRALLTARLGDPHAAVFAVPR